MSGEDAAAGFHVQEMVTLKNEIAELGKEARTYEAAAVAGTFALYAWLLLNDAGEVEKYAWWLPIPFIFICSLRITACFLQIAHIGQYIRRLECRLADSELQGWHHYSDAKKGYRVRSLRDLRSFPIARHRYIILIILGYHSSRCRICYPYVCFAHHVMISLLFPDDTVLRPLSGRSRALHKI